MNFPFILCYLLGAFFCIQNSAIANLSQIGKMREWPLAFPEERVHRPKQPKIITTPPSLRCVKLARHIGYLLLKCLEEFWRDSTQYFAEKQ
jgi:hypothetical protein